MYRTTPYYLLFAESDYDPSNSTGIWQFTLQEIEGSDIVEEAGLEPDVTGERLDLLSVIRGLEALDQPSTVSVVTPSRYVSRGFRFGLPQWRETDWCWERFGEMVPIKNVDLWKRIDHALEFHTVKCRQWSPRLAVENSNANTLGRNAAKHNVFDNSAFGLATTRQLVSARPVLASRLQSINRIASQGRKKVSRFAVNTGRFALDWALRLSGLEIVEQDTLPQQVSS